MQSGRCCGPYFDIALLLFAARHFEIERPEPLFVLFHDHFEQRRQAFGGMGLMMIRSVS